MIMVTVDRIESRPMSIYSSVFGARLRVPYIFGANILLWYAFTRSFFGGCFQAYKPAVNGCSQPLSLRLVLGTLYVCLGCFPLDIRHLSAAVGLWALHVAPSFRVRESLVGDETPLLIRSFTPGDVVLQEFLNTPVAGDA